MGIELREPELIEQVQFVAEQQTRPVEEILERAIRLYLDQWEQQAIHTETEAFWARYDELLAQYAGQHVAMRHGQVVDHDTDAAALDKRVRLRFGRLPVLIAPVRPGPRRELRWFGGKIETAR
jgi:predicted transcriptional regulator